MIGGTVRLQPVSILHGGLSVNVISEIMVSQPNPGSAGTTQVVQQTTVQAEDKPVNHIDQMCIRDSPAAGGVERGRDSPDQRWAAFAAV